jgi:hypothetical protein
MIRLVSGLVVALITGCVQGPDYHRPVVTALAQPKYKYAPGTVEPAAPAIPDEWWQLYSCPPLAARSKTRKGG